jgi:hypothetical protein
LYFSFPTPLVLGGMARWSEMGDDPLGVSRARSRELKESGICVRFFSSVGRALDS